MGWQIIKQPDGKWAIWSSNVDAFVVTDATAEEIVTEFVQPAANEAARRAEAIMEQLERGEPAFHQFTQTWDELQEIIRRRRDE